MADLEAEVADVSMILSKYEISIRNALVLHKVPEWLQGAVSEKMFEIRERIRTGESSGDPLRDHLILRYGWCYAVVETIFRSLKKLVRAHVGEYVLVREAKQTVIWRSSSGAMSPEQEIVPVVKYGFSQLLGGDLVIEVGRCFFPTGLHSLVTTPPDSCLNRRVYDRWNSAAIPLPSHWDFLTRPHTKGTHLPLSWFWDPAVELNQPLPTKAGQNLPANLGSECKLQIVVGTRAVIGYFDSRKRPESFQTLREAHEARFRHEHPPLQAPQIRS